MSTITLNLDANHNAVLTSLAEEQEISKTGLLRQALRLYQTIHLEGRKGRQLAFQNADGSFIPMVMLGGPMAADEAPAEAQKSLSVQVLDIDGARYYSDLSLVQRSSQKKSDIKAGGHDQPVGKIYVASRASVAERPAVWRDLRSKGWHIVSTWIDEAGEGDTDDMCELWDRIHREIALSDGVILYAEAEDFPLKGALVECGIALGMGKPVAMVLPGIALDSRHYKPIGSWAAHPMVSRHERLDDARDWIVASRSTPTDPWRAALDEALIVSCLDCIGPGEAPERALARLIGWEVAVALDPVVSTAAAKLVADAKVQAIADRDRELADLEREHLGDFDKQTGTYSPSVARDGIGDVMAERLRQIDSEGWTPEHDDEHADGSMSIAAACYALVDVNRMRPGALSPQLLWKFTGWEDSWWKPKDHRSNLVRAAALVIAEIDRLDRRDRDGLRKADAA